MQVLHRHRFKKHEIDGGGYGYVTAKHIEMFDGPVEDYKDLRQKDVEYEGVKYKIIYHYDEDTSR